jgi:large subunit ribosomal protein L20
MRIKRGNVRTLKRKRLLAQTKGYRWGRKNKIKLARVAILKAGVYAYRDRRRKKRDFRRLWNIRINAAVREFGFSYSQFINLLQKNKIGLNRKMLSDLANSEPKVFEEIIKEVKK